MRLIGILLIVAGLYFAIAKPWFSTNFTGEELASADIYNKNASGTDTRGWQVSKVFLEKENSPAIVRISVDRLPGQQYGNGKLKLLVRVAPISQSGETMQPILNEAVTVNVENANSGSLPEGSVYTKKISTSEFAVSRTGNYKIGAFPVSSDNVSKGAPDLEIDRNITRISATVMSGVEQVAKPNSFLGFAMIAGGIMLLSFFRRRRNAGTPHQKPTTHMQPEKGIAENEHSPIEEIVDEKVAKDPPPKKRNTNVGKTIKWGRDAGKKR